MREKNTAGATRLRGKDKNQKTQTTTPNYNLLPRLSQPTLTTQLDQALADYENALAAAAQYYKLGDEAARQAWRAKARLTKLQALITTP